MVRDGAGAIPRRTDRNLARRRVRVHVCGCKTAFVNQGARQERLALRQGMPLHYLLRGKQNARLCRTRLRAQGRD